MKTKKLLLRGRFFGNGRAQDVLLVDGVVQQVAPAGGGKPDIGDDNAVILPTLIDIQVNGAMGIDLSSPDLCVENIRNLNKYMAAWGVSQWVPTLVTNALDVMGRGCRVVAEARRDPVLGRAIPGVHLEGPWISPEDGPRGAHPKEHVRPPVFEEFDRLYSLSEGAVAYVTLAPELPGVLEFIQGVSMLGVPVSLGHHNASASQIEAAVAAGARLCTHLGNGMHPMMHRHHNPLWPQLVLEDLMASLIADLHHLPPHVLDAFWRCKGLKNVILVSDLVPLAGLKPGQYEMFGGKVELLPNGKIVIPGTDLLAGSAVPLVHGVFNAARAASLSLKEAVAAATINPGKLLKLKRSGRVGALPEAGKRANFFVVDAENEPVKVLTSFVDGVRA